MLAIVYFKGIVSFSAILRLHLHHGPLQSGFGLLSFPNAVLPGNTTGLLKARPKPLFRFCLYHLSLCCGHQAGG